MDRHATRGASAGGVLWEFVFILVDIYRVSWLCFYSVDVCEDLLADPGDCMSIFLSPILFLLLL
jgi:hypothetical protein